MDFALVKSREKRDHIIFESHAQKTKLHHSKHTNLNNSLNDKSLSPFLSKTLTPHPSILYELSTSVAYILEKKKQNMK